MYLYVYGVYCPMSISRIIKFKEVKNDTVPLKGSRPYMLYIFGKLLKRVILYMREDYIIRYVPLDILLG